MQQQISKCKGSFFKALSISIVFHLLAAFALDQMLVLKPTSDPHNAPLLSNSLKLLKEREEKNLSLKEAFKELKTQDIKQTSHTLVKENTERNFAKELKICQNIPVLSLNVSFPFPVNQFTLPEIPLFSSFDVPKETPLFKEKEKVEFSALPIDPPIELANQALEEIKPIEPSLDIPSLQLEDALSLSAAFAKKSFSLPTLSSLSEFGVLSRSDWFDAEIVFLPIENEEGAEFAVTLMASPDFEATRLSQDFVFLIDRSNSIQKERLFATKQALSRVIKELHPNDRFNLVAFDNKIDKLFPIPMNPTEENLQSALEFLNSIELGSFFSPADLYRPLLFSLPNQVGEDRLTHIVLMTDGEALNKKNIQKALLQDWTQRNQVRASLYAISLESDQNLQSLDALCALNYGKLLTAPTQRGLRKKLLKLIKMVENPIANEVSVTAINKRTGKTIPLSKQIKTSLFKGQPAVFLGSIEKLDDFVLFVQAKIDGKWVHVKKNLSFLHAKRGGRTLRTEIALQKAYMAYFEYSQDNDARHLSEARAILEPFDLIPAFQ